MITLNFDEVLKRIYNAKKGVEVRYGLGQGFEYCKQFADEAQGYATNAKASADKAEQTVAGIEQTKTDAVQAVQSAQTTATTAVQQAQTTATTAITQTKDAALTDIGNAKTGALQEVASSTEAAQTAATKAKESEQAAEKSKEAAATSASTATTKASEASTNAGAASTSRQAAEKAQKAAEDAAALAGTRAGTDKTLRVEDAPADAAATGAALDKKANKDVILDEDGNEIFYSKAETDAKIKEMLAAQRAEDYAKIKFWASDDPTSPASFIGGTWERIEDCTIWGASDTHPAGTKLEAGLPNITGMASTRALNSEYETGVFLTQGKGALKSTAVDSIEKFTNLITTEDGTSKYGGSLAIDASLSNPVYGASNTVQPPAYCTYIWRRVA